MRSILAGLAGLSLALSAGAGALAQPAAPAKPSVETTTIGDLMAKPATLAVLQKDLPVVLSDPRIEQAKGMSLREIQPYSEGKLDDAKLAAVQKDLDAAAKQ